MARENHYVSSNSDAFDNPPEGPVGVHRGSRAWYAVLLPYVIVAVVAAVIGLLMWGIFSGSISQIFTSNNGANQHASSQMTDSQSQRSKDSQSTTQSTQQDADKAEKQKNSQDTADQDKTNSDQDTSSSPIDKNIEVKVVNATQIQGHAAANANKLKEAGYTKVVAANSSGTVPSTSTVWYKDDASRSTAEDIAKVLGIPTVEKADSVLTAVTVVLLK